MPGELWLHPGEESRPSAFPARATETSPATVPSRIPRGWAHNV
jgi:hypothetical protein